MSHIFEKQHPPFQVNEAQSSTLHFDQGTLQQLEMQSRAIESYRAMDELYDDTVTALDASSRNIANITELFKYFLNNPDIYRESFAAKMIMALNESIPQHTAGDTAKYEKYMSAWAELLTKALAFMTTDNDRHNLQPYQAQARNTEVDRYTLNFRSGTVGQRMYLNHGDNDGSWRLTYQAYDTDPEYVINSGFPLALARLFPDRFLVQPKNEPKLRQFQPGERVPLLNTRFVVDLRPGKLSPDSDIDDVPDDLGVGL